jgi:ABC-type sugar transport system substrate-binding protein
MAMTTKGSVAMMKRWIKPLAASCLLAATFAGAASARTIGISIAHFDEIYLALLMDAMRDQAQVRGVEAQFEDAHGDVERQLSQVQNFIAQKFDVIIVNSVDSEATTEITQAATAANIPLVYVLRGPAGEMLPEGVVFVRSDQKVAGTMQGTELAERLGGKGNVVIMQGELADEATLQRSEGVKEIIARHPEMKVLDVQTANYRREQAIDLMSNWLISGLEIDAVAANNDEMAIGALLALQQAGLDPKSVVVAGVDATPDALDYVARGELAFTVFQNAQEQGEQAVDAAVALMEGKPVEPAIYVPFELVTQENYRDFMK